ncbi:hypothetical protein AJ80_02602 [Polytolypa hystricis UAMH7299]|uniref:Uncharacterized protein n=1 Tax=Polytolypa hystricis (strain UAMH7299) TaxID=1447883 RepID=A0A2B7YQN9_POLH7|nr:hypothetical protein AJ80_02602 [Polytolypa hystricis UAMH7299]
MSSPSGRKKAQAMRERRLNASSPFKARGDMPPPQSRASQLLDEGVGDGLGEDDDDDDEETLQLKLAAIEARLKLKKLQQNKARANSSAAAGSDTASLSRPVSVVDSPASRPPSRFLGDRKRKATDITPQEDVQVPLSPTKRPTRPVDPVSPRRVVLGIDKGMKGSEVSLRRAPISKTRDRSDSMTAGNRYDASQRPHGSTELRGGSTPNGGVQRTKSFSERIAESRLQDKAKRDKAYSSQLQRSTGFALDKHQMEDFQSNAQQFSTGAESPSKRNRVVEEFSRTAVLQSYHRPNTTLHRPKSASGNIENSPSAWESTAAGWNTHTRPASSISTRRDDVEMTTIEPEEEDKAPDPSKFESYSGLHLSTRILPHSFLTRTLNSKTPLRIPDLLKSIKAPSFDPPDIDGDYVVFGIVASKSSPRDRQDDKKIAKDNDPNDDGTNNTSKYMVITLTDLHWTVDLFLFSTAFPRYYKLTPGTLIAILNPSIMPPPPHKLDTNRFSLTLNSSDDTVLEIGKAKDLGFCKTIRKDGKPCETWVDSRKTEFCEFHVELQLRKTTSSRMEVNGKPGTLGPGGRSGSRSGMFNTRSSRGGGGGGGGRGGANQGLLREGPGYDRATGSTYYIAPANPGNTGGDAFSSRPSAASILDAEDPFLAAATDFHRGGQHKQERLRNRLANQERERNIARTLSKAAGGSDVGAEYLRLHHSGDSDARSGGTPNSRAQNEATTTRLSARAALGLDSKTAKSASDIKLGHGPNNNMRNKNNRKRAFQDERDGNSNNNTGAGATKPAVTGKKTRFITAKGIREAGRDSFGVPSGGGGGVDNAAPAADYDDDLDIV